MSETAYWLNKDSRKFLAKGYLKPGQTAEQRIREIADHAEKLLGISGFADKFESYMLKGWYSLSSPVWSNFGNKRGLSISCNGSYISDSIASIAGKVAEVAMMSKHGAGTSAYFGDVRPRGAPITDNGESSGSVHFMQWFECTTDIISQGSTRRGSMAAYLPIDHKDLEEFLLIKDAKGPIQNLSIGVCISDQWMQEMIAGDKKKQGIWAKIIAKKFKSGYPYIFFTDTVNNNKPQVYKDKNMKIHASNLCSEICLPSSEDESFVCNLASMNLLHFEDWEKTDAVETLTYFLDASMTEYIEKTKDLPFMEAAHKFAVNHRALGIGVLGWHSLLQSKLIPFESMEAKFLNTQIHRCIKTKSYAASKEMAAIYGEPEVLKGYGMRNTTTMAIAPTTSSSFILGQVSAGIEPYHYNYHVEDNAKGKFTFKNPYLTFLLETYKKNDDETWKSILMNNGSVQHLTFMTDNERSVFKTFLEISQKEIVIQAAARQKYIDQSQSLNLMIHPMTKPKDVSDLYIFAWENGVKSLYYQRGQNLTQEMGRINIHNCVSCEA